MKCYWQRSHTRKLKAIRSVGIELCEFEDWNLEFQRSKVRGLILTAGKVKLRLKC